MNDELEQEVKELFEAAMKLEPRKRAAFIEVACSDDEHLKRQLDSLITAHTSKTSAAADPDGVVTGVVEGTNLMGEHEVSPEPIERLEKIIDAALELEASERAVFLSQTCAGDEALREEVAARLAARADLGAGQTTTGARLNQNQSLIGQRLGSYLIQQELGRGGMGIVYLAQDTRLGRPVALKVLPVALTADVRRVRRFKQEARAASALNHPNIVTIYDIDEVDAVPFLVAEFIEGKTVSKLIRSFDIPPGRAVDIAMQIASAQIAAHEAGIIHRDIKSENVMVRRDGYVKVVDFGLAKLTEKPSSKLANDSPFASSFHTNPGVVLGTANYMSPEQARGKEIDARSDIFSLGVVMYEMFTGEKPFDGETASDVIAKILTAEPAPLSNYARDLPEAIQGIVSRALRKNREQRYQSAGELSQELQEVKEELALQARQRRSSSSPSASENRRGGAPEPNTKAAAPATGVALARTAASSTGLGGFPTAAGSKRTARLITIGVVVALVSLVALFAWRKFAAPKPPFIDNLRLARASFTGKTDIAAISPDGKYLAYTVADANGRQRLQLKQMVANNSREIASLNAGYYGGITFSRDNNFIYYVVVEVGDYRHLSLYQLPTFGGSERKILDNVYSPITFSPNGKEFAFIRRMEGGDTALMIAGADGAGERAIATHQSPDRFDNSGPAWSPDGKLIACGVERVDEQGHLYYVLVSVSINDGKETTINQTQWLNTQQVEWLPEGNGLLAIASLPKMTATQVWYVPYPQGEARRLTNDLNYYSCLSITADGQTVSTIRKEDSMNLWLVPFGIRAMAKPITSGVARYQDAVWTRDGNLLVDSNISGTSELWMMAADGSQMKQITFRGDGNHSPSLAPDGRVVCSSRRDGQYHIWLLEGDEGKTRKLTDSEKNFNPQFSPDGKWIVYSSTNMKRWSIWKVAADGGQPVQLAESNTPCIADISPDQKFIVYQELNEATKKSVAIIIPFDGGQPVKTIALPPSTGVSIRWTADGQGLIFANNQGGSSELWFQPLAGGEAKQLTDFQAAEIHSFSLSADGKQLVVACGSKTSDAVLLTDIR